jgi:F-box-like
MVNYLYFKSLQLMDKLTGYVEDPTDHNSGRWKHLTDNRTVQGLPIATISSVAAAYLFNCAAPGSGLVFGAVNYIVLTSLYRFITAPHEIEALALVGSGALITQALLRTVCKVAIGYPAAAVLSLASLVGQLYRNIEPSTNFFELRIDEHRPFDVDNDVFYLQRGGSLYLDNKKYREASLNEYRFVDGEGNDVRETANFNGRLYLLIAIKERELPRLIRGFLGTLFVVCSLGIALFSKNVRNFFTETHDRIYFGVGAHREKLGPVKRERDPIDPTFSLPNEVIHQIFSSLTPEELKRCSKVSKAWNAIASDRYTRSKMAKPNVEKRLTYKPTYEPTYEPPYGPTYGLTYYQYYHRYYAALR